MIADFLTSLLPWNSLENPRTSLNDPNAFGASSSSLADSGIHVTATTAMTLAPVWQALAIISGDFAASTANVYRRVDGGDRTIDIKHPADFLISEEANDEQSADEVWSRFMIHCLLWQNGYLYVEREGGVGRPLAIYNLLPDRTFPKRDETGTRYYVTKVDGIDQPLSKEQVIDVKGLSLCDSESSSLVAAARNSWGLSLAAEGFGAKFFANGAQAGGVLEVPLGTTPEAADKLAAGVQKKYTGKDNWFRTMVLRDGAKFHQTTIDAQKSQLTELREHQVRDTARFFNLPPSKLGLADSVSYNSSEQSQIQYITGCLTHWFNRVRRAAQMKLLTKQERRDRTHFIDFNTGKLIERDLKTQVEILAIERQNEIINAAEWRRKRNLPPRTDPKAEEYINPNTKSAGTQSAEPTSPAKQDAPAEPPKNRLTPATTLVCEDAINRIARRVTAHARNAAKTPSKLVNWLDTKAHEHRDVFHQLAMPAATLAAEATGQQADDICFAWGGKFFASIVGMLDPVTKPPHLSADIEANVDQQCTMFEAAICADLLSNLTRSST